MAPLLRWGRGNRCPAGQEVLGAPAVLSAAPSCGDGGSCYGFLGAPGWPADQAGLSHFLPSFMAEVFGFLLIMKWWCPISLVYLGNFVL